MRRIPRWLKVVGIAFAVIVVSVMALLIGLGWYVKKEMLDSGGKISPNMAASESDEAFQG